MEPKWLRLAYVFEFLLALMAVFTIWSQVGGQGHLDLIAWWWKLIVGVGGAAAVVRATMAAVAAEHAWNRCTLRWLLVVLAFAAGAGLLVYYYHTYAETQEQQQEEDNVPALLSGLFLTDRERAVTSRAVSRDRFRERMRSAEEGPCGVANGRISGSSKLATSAFRGAFTPPRIRAVLDR